MRKLNQNNLMNFESKDDLFEFLVQESQSFALKEFWKLEFKQLASVSKKEKIINRISKFKQAAVLLTALFLLLISFYWITKTEHSLQRMANKMLVETQIIAVSESYTRGFEAQNEDLMAKELQNEINMALVEKDYNSAIGLFFTKENQSQLSIDDKFYYALSISQIENADFHKALRMLEDVIANNEIFVNESLWLQGLLYIKVKNPIRAKLILKKLERSSIYQNQNVKVLLNELNKTN